MFGGINHVKIEAVKMKKRKYQKIGYGIELN